MQVSSIRQFEPTGRFRLRETAARTGKTLTAQALHGRVINEYTAILHHLLDVAQAQRVGHVPAHAGQHYFKSVVQPFESLAPCAVDQTLAEIEHGPDCRLCLMQHNRPKSLRSMI